MTTGRPAGFDRVKDTNEQRAGLLSVWVPIVSSGWIVLLGAGGISLPIIRKYVGRALGVALAVVISTVGWAAFGPAVFVSGDARHGLNPKVGMDRNGNAIAVWAYALSTQSVIQLRTRTAAGAYSAVQAVTPSQATSLPEIAVAPDGRSVIAWLFHDGTNLRVQARARSATGALSPIVTLSPAGENAITLKVVIAPDGDALVVWNASAGSTFRVKGRTRSAAGTLSGVITFSPLANSALEPDVAMDTEGDALVVWSNSSNSDIQARSLSRTGVLSAIQKIADIGFSARVATDADGDSFIIWRFINLEGRSRSKAGALAAVQTISTASVSDQTVGMDSAGNAFVAWANGSGGSLKIELRKRTVAGALSAVQTLSTPGQRAANVSLGVAANGEVVASWEREGSNTQDVQIQARARAVSGALGPIATLSTDNTEARDPAVGIDPDGDVLVVWRGGHTGAGAIARVRASKGP